MKKLLITFVLFLPLIVFSQSPNLIANGDFESILMPPTGAGQLSNSIGWTNLNGNTNWPYGTPDFFNAFGTGGTAWPNTYAGDVVPHSGNSLAGFITNNFFSPDFREYISYQLGSTMVPGQNYTISFWLTNGSGNFYGGRGTNNIGVALTVDQPSQIQHEPLAIVPQLEITTIVHNTVWQQYSFTFTATNAFRYVTIGNFRNDANTAFQTFTSGYGLAFYFIDNIGVSEVGALNAETIALAQIENENSLELSWDMPNDANGSSFVLERSLDQNSFVTLDLSEVDGNQIGNQRFVDPNALPGLNYFYRLRETDINGKISYSPILEASFGKVGGYAAGNIFPNPVKTDFAIDFASIDEGELQLELINMEGRIVMQELRSIEAGQSQLKYELPKGISAGIYSARFTYGNERFSRQVLVVSEN